MTVERWRGFFLQGYLNRLECDEVNAVPGRVPSDASVRSANRYDGKQRPKASKSRGDPWIRIFRLRSEERRVGKECRSLCDWSSDVCSSDLGSFRCFRSQRQSLRRETAAEGQQEPGRSLDSNLSPEIGRASCRERV